MYYLYILTCSISHGPWEPTVDQLNMNKIWIWIWTSLNSKFTKWLMDVFTSLSLKGKEVWLKMSYKFNYIAVNRQSVPSSQHYPRCRKNTFQTEFIALTWRMNPMHKRFQHTHTICLFGSPNCHQIWIQTKEHCSSKNC